MERGCEDPGMPAGHRAQRDSTFQVRGGGLSRPIITFLQVQPPRLEIELWRYQPSIQVGPLPSASKATPFFLKPLEHARAKGFEEHLGFFQGKTL